MKKITLFFVLLFMSVGFAQDIQVKIQNYLSESAVKYRLKPTDIQSWTIIGENSSESTGINNKFIQQKYQGLDIYNAISNVWVKGGKVINIVNGFQSDVEGKVSSVTASMSVIDALNQAHTLLNEPAVSHTIIENQDNTRFKLTNGSLSDSFVTAKLVIAPKGNNLFLAWSFEFYSQDNKHLWSIRVNALNGNLVDKNDLVISCKFDNLQPENCISSSNENHTHTKVNMFKPQSFLQVLGGSYRVVPYNYESPNHITRQLVSNPENALASPRGWHDSNSLTGNVSSLRYNYTRGNNAFARDDRAGTNGIGSYPLGAGTYPNFTFDFPYTDTTADAATYTDASVTNLFYMTNIMHDVWWQYGFNEANRNFQINNYGRGGTGNDSVICDAQDGATANPPTLNNANFSTPADGSAPRVQMFLWNTPPRIKPLFITAGPTALIDNYFANQNAFSPGSVALPVAPNQIQSTFVLYDDGSPDVGQTDNADACGPAVNAAQINGKICVIRRSTSIANGGSNPCTFVQKVLNAQSAGAIAVIIVNNVPGGISMSGSDASVNIPAISVNQSVGDPIIAAIKAANAGTGPAVVGKIQLATAPVAFKNADGDFDNGIIGHEFGHGISNRLISPNANGLSNAEQMGEGWSDWFAMMMQIKQGDVGTMPRGIATFAVSQPTTGSGIRSFQYCTDMSVNPLTFVNSNAPEPSDPTDTGYRYVIGDFWATTLWDLSWAYISKYGFDSNIYTGTGGNNKVMRLVLDAIKLMAPGSPTIVGGRDALFAADQNTTGGQDFCLIGDVFSRRGVGLNASSGSPIDSNDQVESFTPFTPGPNCVLSVNYFQNEDLFRIYPNPSNGLFNVRINNYVGKVNIQVIDVNGRIVNEFKNDDFNIEKEINLTNLQTGMYIVKVNADDLNFTKKIIIN